MRKVILILNESIHQAYVVDQPPRIGEEVILRGEYAPNKMFVVERVVNVYETAGSGYGYIDHINVFLKDVTPSTD